MIERLHLLNAGDKISRWEFGLRVAWIAIEIILVYLIGQKGVLFFYQGF